MNNEIKYIIQRLEYVKPIQESSTSINGLEIKLLLDYITNLQETIETKNKGIKALTDELCETTMKLEELQLKHKQLKDLDKIQKAFEDYKSRCDKAIEYIKDWQSFPHTNGSTHNELKNLLNILQGRR